MPRRSIRLLRALLAIPLGLLCAELLLRAAALVLAPDAREERVPASDATILCLGDSNTFGYGVEERDAYPARLEALCERRAPEERLRVVNLGVPGLSSRQVARQIPAELERSRPRAVLVLCGVNNLWSWTPESSVTLADPPWYESLRLVRLARLVAARVRPEPASEGFLPGDMELERFEGRPGGINRTVDREGRALAFDAGARRERLADEELLAVFLRDLEDMRAACGSAGVPLFLLTYASEHSSYRHANEVIRAAAARTSVPLIECAAVFGRLLEQVDFEDLFFQDGHPRPPGYELVARLVYDALCAHGILAAEPLDDVTRDLELEHRPPPPLFLRGVLGGEPGTPDELRLEIRGEEAGRPFALLLSGSGEGPHAELSGYRLPLVDDAIFRLAAGAPSLVGELDGHGDASVPLTPLVTAENEDRLRGLRVLALYAILTDSEEMAVRRISDPIEVVLE